mgnify:CR=1 FL=1
MTASKLANPGEIVKFLKPGYRIFIHGAAATPIRFLDALREESSARLDLELLHLHLHGPVAWKNTKGIRDTSLFVGENLRGAINHNNIDYLPCFLSEIPSLFRKGIRKPDIAIVQVSPPDSSGHCSLGTSVDIARAAIDSASIAPRMRATSFRPIACTSAGVNSVPVAFRTRKA